MHTSSRPVGSVFPPAWSPGRLSISAVNRYWHGPYTGVYSLRYAVGIRPAWCVYCISAPLASVVFVPADQIAPSRAVRRWLNTEKTHILTSTEAYRETEGEGHRQMHFISNTSGTCIAAPVTNWRSVFKMTTPILTTVFLFVLYTHKTHVNVDLKWHLNLFLSYHC